MEMAHKIYHIIHIDRLSSIIQSNELICDAQISTCNSKHGTTIGNHNIKERRLTRAIECHENLHVGECVPFYFCPRSVMLYVIFRKDHPGITYHDGQENIIHLECDLNETIEFADAHSKRWAFTNQNASANYASFYKDRANLNNVPWNHVQNPNWGSSPEIKEGKQAEFLIEHSCPWFLIKRIGVYSPEIVECVHAIITQCAPRYSPVIQAIPEWYY